MTMFLGASVPLSEAGEVGIEQAASWPLLITVIVQAGHIV